MLSELPDTFLFGLLLLLILLSGFFSGSETAIFSLNRYRLRHKAKAGHLGARRANNLLKRPDRLIGIILLGNNFVNILASSIATILAMRYWGEAGIAIAAGLLTLVILIFSEVTPKTIAALHPERFAYPASMIIGPLLKIFYPLVWAINMITNSLLHLFGVSAEHTPKLTLSTDELRTVVHESASKIPERHQQMLLSILDLDKATVEDIMVPRNEIAGIDLEEDMASVVKQITNSQHTRLPIYRGSIDHVIGFIHLRNVLALHRHGELTRENLLRVVRETYFVPEGSSLHAQLYNFQTERRRIGLVVDEYGDIQGLVTLDDILEEIVGEFTSDPATRSRNIHSQVDGSYLVDGSANIREINRVLGWHLPTAGPKTLNGMVIEYLESIPEPGTSFLLNGHPVEIVKTSGNRVKTIRIDPAINPGVDKHSGQHS